MIQEILVLDVTVGYFVFCTIVNEITYYIAVYTNWNSIALTVPFPQQKMDYTYARNRSPHPQMCLLPLVIYSITILLVTRRHRTKYSNPFMNWYNNITQQFLII